MSFAFVGLNIQEHGLLRQLLARLRHRVGTDFRFAILSLFGFGATAGIVPFAGYRFATGNWKAGVMDLVIVILLLSPVVWAMTRTSTRGPAILQVLLAACACVAATILLGRDGVLWTYCFLVASFFLVERVMAMSLGLGVVALIVLLGNGFGELHEHLAYMVTASVVSLFAFIFATRTDQQRLQLESLASHDPLTGAGNRRLMETELEESVALFQRRPRPTMLAVVDMDHFKQINDRYGHEAGDRVLADFAAIVRGRLRKMDRLYRLGGEEFVLLLPATPLSALPSVLERLQEALRAELRSPGGPVTVSMGAAALHVDEAWSEWLARADAALYRAKHGGRDRFEIDLDPAAHVGSVEVLAERRSRLG